MDELSRAVTVAPDKHMNLKESRVVTYKIVWDNGHTSGILYGKFETKEQAEAFAENWLREMIALDSDPKAAEETYSVTVQSGQS